MNDAQRLARFRQQFVDAMDRGVGARGLRPRDLEKAVGGDLAALYREALGDLDGSPHAARPAVFITVGRHGVHDVSSEDGEAVDMDYFVIDESCCDPAGRQAELEADDGTTFPARVKRVAATPVHFDAGQVRAASGSAVWANGQRVDETPEGPGGAARFAC